MLTSLTDRVSGIWVIILDMLFSEVNTAHLIVMQVHDIWYHPHYPSSPRVLSPFCGGGIVYLKDPDTNIAMLGGVYTPVRASQARQVEG